MLTYRLRNHKRGLFDGGRPGAMCDDDSEPFDFQYRTLKHHKKKLKKL